MRKFNTDNKNYELSAELRIIIIQTVRPTAAKASTAAAIARTLSIGLIFDATAGATGLRGAAVVAAAGAAAAERAAAAGAAELRNGGAPAAGGAGAAGAALDAPVGPPGGNVGNLMVGAAVGFGGRLMRTVSFLGWTRPVDFFIGSAPAGAPGLIGGMSAINLFLKIRFAQRLSNLILKEKQAGEIH
jgi:hypothetical protein